MGNINEILGALISIENIEVINESSAIKYLEMCHYIFENCESDIESEKSGMALKALLFFSSLEKISIANPYWALSYFEKKLKDFNEYLPPKYLTTNNTEDLIVIKNHINIMNLSMALIKRGILECGNISEIQEKVKKCIEKIRQISIN